MSKLKVAIVTPDRLLAKGEVDMVIAPSVSGQVGVLPNHHSLLATLEEGVVELRSGASADLYAVSGGFLEVDRNAVRVLADTAEPATEIDTGRSQKALEDAEKQLKTLEPLSDEFSEQQSRIRRARVRLSVAAH